MKYSSIAIINRTLLYMLIFTVISSAIAFSLVIKAYDTVYEISSGDRF